MSGYGNQFEDGVQTRWNAHSLLLYMTCPRKYYYEMIEGWHRESTSVHLIFGTHYAKGLERFLKYRSEGADREEAIERVTYEALCDTWGWHSDHDLKNRFTLVRSLVWYFDHFKKDMPVWRDPNGEIGVERKFEIAVDDGITFVGTLDRVVEHVGGPWIMDQKTTSSTLNRRYFDQFKPHTQATMYAFAGSMIFSTPVKGIIIDAAQIAEYHTEYGRDFTFRTQAELQEWYEESLLWIKQVQEATRRALDGANERAFPMNTSSCNDYGGCPFRPICAKSPEVRRTFLRSEFEQPTDEESPA